LRPSRSDGCAPRDTPQPRRAPRTRSKCHQTATFRRALLSGRALTARTHESGRPGSNRRRPAWEAFLALAEQGVLGGGSRNGITQYVLAARDIRDFPLPRQFQTCPPQPPRLRRRRRTTRSRRERQARCRTELVLWEPGRTTHRRWKYRRNTRRPRSARSSRCGAGDPAGPDRRPCTGARAA